MRSPSPIMGYWARKAGGHVGKDGQLTIKGKRGSNTGRSNSGDKSQRSIARKLVEQAAGFGFYNGVRIKK